MQHQACASTQQLAVWVVCMGSSMMARCLGSLCKGITQSGANNVGKDAVYWTTTTVLDNQCVCILQYRSNFLQYGTMAKGAAESGAVESYMCGKVARNPLVQRSCAAYLGEFEAEETANGIQKGTQWLIWKFESDSTLGDALSGNLGEWPEDIEEIMLGKIDEDKPVEKREAAVRV